MNKNKSIRNQAFWGVNLWLNEKMNMIRKLPLHRNKWRNPNRRSGTLYDYSEEDQNENLIQYGL